MAADYARHARIWDWGGVSRTEELTFWDKMAAAYGPRILAPMCAIGELVGGLADMSEREERRLVGIDLTAEMIEEAQRRYGNRAGLDFLCADIANFTVDEQFDFAFIASTDLHHLLESDLRMQALTNLRKHTRLGGGLGLELWYPSQRSFASDWQRFDQQQPRSDGLVVWKRGRTSYDADTLQVSIEQEVYIEERGQTEMFPHAFTLQLFSPADLPLMLSEAGYRLEAEYGDYDGSAWQQGASKWLVEAVAVE